jgi:hypothetical protein
MLTNLLEVVLIQEDHKSVDDRQNQLTFFHGWIKSAIDRLQIGNFTPGQVL